MVRVGRRGVVAALVLSGAIAAIAATPAAARNITRYFDVKIHASGQLHSAPVCNENAPCEGDYLTGHGMDWEWIAYALVVAQQRGNHTTMHLIGPAPRVAAYFVERVSYSRSNDCLEDFSTGHGNRLDRFMAMNHMFFEDQGGLLSVDVGSPLNSHFSRCGPGTVSTHGRDYHYASWDGLDGPWHYAGTRGPTRGQVRTKRVFVDLAYNAGLGVEHTVDGWKHTSCCGSNLTLTFTRFRGGQRNVFAHERSFARHHPVTSHGFTKCPGGDCLFQSPAGTADAPAG
jgi:hypothetical protein